MNRRTFINGALLALLAAGCSLGDNEASIAGPSGPMALGAYHEVWLGDSCSGGGKLTLCSSEAVTELLVLESDNPDVVELVDAKTRVPTKNLAAPLALHALKVGRATLRGRGRFNDGSEREATRTVEVRAVKEVKVGHNCPDDTSTRLRVPCSEFVHLSAVLYNGADRLEGELDDVLAGDGLMPSTNSPARSDFLWKPATCPARTALSSRLDRAFSLSIETFGPADVTGLKVGLTNAPPLFVEKPAEVPLDTYTLIDRTRTCASLPAAARTTTPEVCVGPNGEREWSHPIAGRLMLRVLREGICRLVVGAAGGAFNTPFETQVFFVRRAEGDPFVSAGNSCDVEGRKGCEPGRTGSIVCTKGSWAAQATCGADQICDYTPAGESGCDGSAPCPACRNQRGP